MTKKTIGELDDVTDTQQDDAVCAIEQTVGITPTTFKARVRPNPPTQVNVTSQAQLITKFGSNLEIPDGQNFTVFLDASFTLNIPFKIGLGSSLEVTSQVIGIALTYTGVGALFQNFNSVNPINRLFLSNLVFFGDTNNKFIDVQSNNRVTLSNMGVDNFEDLGDISADNSIDLSNVIGIFFNKGLRLSDAGVIICRDLASVNGVTNDNPTFLSIIGGSAAMKIFLNTIEGVDLNTGDNLFFLDPNFQTNTAVVITESFMSDSGNFYQQGIDTPILSAAIGTSGAGFTNFTAIGAHGLKPGRVIVNSTFSDANYNGTFVVVSTPSNTVYEVKALFTATGLGNMNAASLDQTSPVVTAALNPGQADSQTQLESRNVTSPIPVVLVTQNIFVNVSVTGNEQPGDFIQDPATELFTLDTATGIFTYNGEHDVSVLASFRLTLQKASGGGDEDYEVSLFENSTEITKTRTLFTATPSGAGNSLTNTYNGGILTISQGDTFTLKVRSTDISPTNVNVTDLTILFIET